MLGLKGIIFDLDGTLVDSKLDFDRMREEIGIPDRRPVLEYVEALPEGEFKDQCWQILLRHEFRGAESATLMPGIAELLSKLDELEISQGILTRNQSQPTRLVLDRLGLKNFSPVLTREDAPPKPDPTGLLMICEAWRCSPGEVVFIGDYRFDLLAGNRAGMKTVLYAPKGLPSYAHEADHVVADFHQLVLLFETVFGHSRALRRLAGGARLGEGPTASLSSISRRGR